MMELCRGRRDRWRDHGQRHRGGHRRIGELHPGLTWAIEEAKLRGARVRAVLTWSYMGQSDGVLGVGTTEPDARQALQAIIDSCAGDDAGIVGAVTVNDLPVDGLLEEARTASMVVVGSRGRGGIKGLLLGSTSRAVVERSPVPVVVIPLHG
ncbi:MAG: universal stress protein [Acidimicrobiales bacterium]